jgi:hypothetical protein
MEIEPDFVINNTRSLKTLLANCETVLEAMCRHQSLQADRL